MNYTSKTPVYIFIDGSYYCFYRYYALIQWCKHTNNEYINIEENKNKLNNEDTLNNEDKLNNEDENLRKNFIDKFQKVFINNLKNLPKKLKINLKEYEPYLIIGKDCPQSKIWRNELLQSYKESRIKNNNIGYFFKLVYNNELFIKGGAKLILEHDNLEADDCIALYVKYLNQKNSDNLIYIITSDRDYLQLNNKNVNIYNLSFKNICCVNKNTTGDPKKDLKIKIIMGDKSDNIPPIFKKCGIKTALKCINDESYFSKRITENIEILRNYERNEKLVNFDFIPENYKNDFINKYSLLHI